MRSYLLVILAVAPILAQTADVWADLDAAAPAEAAVAPAPSDTLTAPPAIPASDTALIRPDSVPVPEPTAVISDSLPASAVAVDSVTTQDSATTADSAANGVAISDSAAPSGPSPEEQFEMEMRLRSRMRMPPDRTDERYRTGDSAASSASPPAPETAVVDSGPPVSRRDLLGPVKVSRVHAIDDLKGRYKSPRRALFLSLALPGAGQIYVGGSSWNYARGAAYLTAELALGLGWYHYSVRLYDRQVRKYTEFARRQYSLGLYERRMLDLYNTLDSDADQEQFRTLYRLEGAGREEYCRSIYGSVSAFGCDAFGSEQAHLQNFPPEQTLGDSRESRGGFRDETSLLRLIALDDYVVGWVDAGDSMRTVGSIDLSGETKDPLSASVSRTRYIEMRNQATEYADMQAYFLGGLLLNHIISAVDAALSARSHNAGLYQERLAWHQRIRLQSHTQWAPYWVGRMDATLSF